MRNGSQTETPKQDICSKKSVCRKISQADNTINQLQVVSQIGIEMLVLQTWISLVQSEYQRSLITRERWKGTQTLQE